MKTILHPTDFTANSEKIFRWLCAIAQQDSARVIVLHVISPEICPPENRVGTDVKRNSFIYQSCWERYSRLVDIAKGIEISFQIKIGHPVETITKVAQVEDCDLIALAASHHTYLYYGLRGGIADTLLRTCPVPVLFMQTPTQLPTAMQVASGAKQTALESSACV
jgi:nucleotide-binding universal stress UspA family protein